jgi:hypothetical protein
MNSPTFEAYWSDILAKNPSIFVRKFSRRGHLEEGNAQSAAEKIFKEVFATDDKFASLYKVSVLDDLDFVAGVIIYTREKPDEPFFLIWMTPAELASCDISFKQKNDSIVCGRARKLHHDAQIDEKRAVQLCTILKGQTRQCFRFDKALIISTGQRLNAKRCRSVKGNESEICELRCDGWWSRAKSWLAAIFA